MGRTKKRYARKKKSRRRLRKQRGGDKSKAYVINLDKRMDRWEQIQKSFKDSSIQLERVSAVENSDGYLGCSLSFLKVVQIAKDNNMPTVLIFEDDNKPIDDFDKRWQKLKKWLDNNLDKWEIFNGGGAWHEFEHEGHEQEFDIHLKYKLSDNINLFNCAKVLRTNWIYINNSAYDKVLKWSRDLPDKDVTFCIDTYIGNRKYFNTLCIYPFLGTQENGLSDLMKSDKNTTIEDERRKNFMNKILEKQLKNNKKVVFQRNPNGGFFSNFNMLIDNLVNDNNIVEIEYNVLSGGDSLKYIKENEELFSKLFEPYKTDKEYKYIEYIDTYKDKNIVAKDASNMYAENRNKLQPYNDAFNKYIIIKPHIKDKINNEIKELQKGNPDKIIGIFKRSNNLASEQPSGKMPSREEYIQKIDSLNISDKTKFFLRIDNDDDLDFFKKKYQFNYYTTIKRSKNSSSNAPHLYNLQTLNDLESIFIEIYLLSKCDILIHCVSNMATASLYMNMKQESVFIK